MRYYTSMMCSVVLAACTGYQLAVSLRLVVLGMEPSHVDILSKSIHVYVPTELFPLYDTRNRPPVEDMYRHPMDDLE